MDFMENLICSSDKILTKASVWFDNQFIKTWFAGSIYKVWRTVMRLVKACIQNCRSIIDSD